MTNDEIKTANKTAICSVKNALIPRIIKNKFPYRDYKMLDFGSGPKAIQTNELRLKGYTDVTSYEFGSNVRLGVHLSPNLLRTCDIEMYDLVFASNVLNTLSSLSAVKETLEKIAWFVNSDGFALFDYPSSPRECKELTLDRLKRLAYKQFKSVMVENHDGTRVFYCYKQGQNNL